MNERIKQIIAYLIDPESSEWRDPAMTRTELEDMGYSPDEIRQATAMLEWDVSRGAEPFRTASTRILEFVSPVSIDEVREIASRYIIDLPDDIPSEPPSKGSHIH